MPSSKTTSRKAASKIIIYLTNVIDKCVAFQCSSQFEDDVHNPDEDEPLDVIQWNDALKEYEIDKSSSNDFVIDDAILQAMVMFFVLGRLQHGWTQAETVRQLSIWPKHHPKPNLTRLSSLHNLWGLEHKKLIRNKKIGKTTLNHVQNYTTICHLYYEEGWYGREARKTNTTHFGILHKLTEQSCIQWALDQKEKEPLLSELAVVLIKLLFQCDYSQRKDVMAKANALSNILLSEAQKDDDKLHTFCQRVLIAIEKLNWEEIFHSFSVKEFTEQFTNTLKESSPLRRHDFAVFFTKS